MSIPKTIRTALAFAVVVGLGLGVSACNTFDGLGEDFKSAGKSLGLVEDGEKKE